jgi:hypothetical protein
VCVWGGCIGGHRYVFMVIDRKTGRELHTGDTLIRKDYKGFKHRYELLELSGTTMIRVKKLTQGDRWVYLCVPLASLQLDFVIV